MLEFAQAHDRFPEIRFLHQDATDMADIADDSSAIARKYQQHRRDRKPLDV
jgi:hypothetical protein